MNLVKLNYRIKKDRSNFMQKVLKYLIINYTEKDLEYIDVMIDMHG